jgi:hypothetical protein
MGVCGGVQNFCCPGRSVLKGKHSRCVALAYFSASFH